MTLQDQIKEVQREVALRKRLYPKWIKRGDMTEGQAEYFLEAMAAIVRTLTELDAQQYQLPLFGVVE